MRHSQDPGIASGLEFGAGRLGVTRRLLRSIAPALATLLSLALAGCAQSGGSDGPPAYSGNLLVVPRSPWLLSTLEGSMPGESSRDFELTNTSGEVLDWMALSTQPWLSVSPTGGQLVGGASVTATATLDAVSVTAFTPGRYDAELEFHDLSVTPPTIVVVPVTLTVIAAQTSVTVTPLDGFTAIGPQGGPFAPPSKTYTIENTGNVVFDWSISASQGWIQLPTPASGSVAPTNSVQVQVGIHQATAASLNVGQHTAQVTVFELGQGVPVAVREVGLDVQDIGGWTQFSPSADTRVVYVSSSQGNDANDGLSAATPKRTIGAGLPLLRHGYPDWLLLRKGDVWDSSLGHWKKSGRSASEPMVIWSYGTGARPKLRTGIEDGLFTGSGGGSPAVIEHLAVSGLHFVPHLYDGTNSWCGGFKLFQQVNNLLIEDCYIERYKDNLVFQGSQGQPHRNIRVRRSILVDNYADPAIIGHSQGVYTYAVEDILFEENLFDKIGQQNPNIYRHALYVDSEHTSGVVLRGNIISDTGSHGAQLRPGGVAEDNLFVRTPIALLLGGGESWMIPGGGATGTLSRNVILDSKNTNASIPRGWGIVLENVISAAVEENVIANSPMAGDPRPVQIGFDNDKILSDVEFRRNVISGWGGAGIRVLGDGNSVVQRLTLDSNQVQNLVDGAYLAQIVDGSATSQITSQDNVFFSAAMAINSWFSIAGLTSSLDEYKNAVGDTTSVAKQVSYPDASASLGKYHANLGKTGTHDAFMLEARQQSRDNWRPEYTAAAVNSWVRSKFGM